MIICCIHIYNRISTTIRIADSAYKIVYKLIIMFWWKCIYRNWINVIYNKEPYEWMNNKCSSLSKRGVINNKKNMNMNMNGEFISVSINIAQWFINIILQYNIGQDSQQYSEEVCYIFPNIVLMLSITLSNDILYRDII